MKFIQRKEGVFIAMGSNKILIEEQMEIIILILFILIPLIIGVVIGYNMGTLDTVAQMKTY